MSTRRVPLLLVPLLALAAGVMELVIGVWALGYPGRSAWLLVLWVVPRLVRAARAGHATAVLTRPGGADLLALRALTDRRMPSVLAADPDAVAGWRRGDPDTIRALTLYAFSEQNWARPDLEVDALMQLLREFLLSRDRTACRPRCRWVSNTRPSRSY